MAEYVTKKSALINELNELKIYSRGIDVSINKPADEYAIHICNKNGIDISGHISKSIDDNDIYLSDIIVAMDYYQLKYMKIKYPTQAHKIILLTCYYKYSLYTIKNLGIKDPYGRPIDIFEESFIVISECIENLIRYIMCASER